MDSTYSIEDIVQVKDPWDFTQQLKFREGSDMNYIYMSVYYNGDLWV